VHPKAGALAAGSLLLVEAAAFVRARPIRVPQAKRALVLAMGFALGLAPLVVESMLLYHEPIVLGALVGVRAPTVAPVAGGSGAGGGSGSDAPGAEGEGAGPAAPVEPVLVWPHWIDIIILAFKSHTVFGDLAFLPTALWATWIGSELVTDKVTVQLGILMIAPILVAAPFGFLARRRQWDEADAFLAIHFVALVLVYGITAARATTGGYESRYMYVAYPALALWAGAWLAPRLTASPARGIGPPLAFAGALLLVVLTILGAGRPDYTRDFFVLRRLGQLCALLVLVACIVRVATRRAPRIERASRLFDPAIVALALVPSLLFLVQYLLHYPPRVAIGAASGENVDLLLPMAASLREGLVAWIGT
jgi:hypothetical protein